MYSSRAVTVLLVAVSLAAHVRADIYRLDNGTVVPGTEGINPGPGVQLNQLDLTYAILNGQDLSNARFDESNLTRAQLSYSTLANATFVGSVVNYTQFQDTTSRGFTKDQLYATASYLNRNLSGIDLSSNDLSGWDFRGQNLANANLYFCKLTNVDLRDAAVSGADFWDTTSRGFTKEQLYSTASFQAKNLSGIGLAGNNLEGWDFQGQNLTGARFVHATLTNVNLTGAVVAGASFTDTTARGLTKEQLYSTSSYQAKNLRGIDLSFGNDLSGWDFHGQDLTNASFDDSELLNADLNGAVIVGADFGYVTPAGFLKEQLYSTASYQAKNLAGVSLYGNDMRGWDFSGQDLSHSLLFSAKLDNANLRGANLTHVNFGGTTLTNADLSAADTRGVGILNAYPSVLHNTIFPDGFIDGLDLPGGDLLVIRNYQAEKGFGAAPIPIHIGERLRMAPGGALHLLFDDEPWESLISFEPNIPVYLNGGTLELAFAADVDLSTQVGRTFRVFDWTGVAPTGACQVTSPYRWELSHLYTTGDITLIAVPEPSAALLATALAILLTANRRKLRLRCNSGRIPAAPFPVWPFISAAPWYPRGSRTRSRAEIPALSIARIGSELKADETGHFGRFSP